MKERVLDKKDYSDSEFGLINYKSIDARSESSGFRDLQVSQSLNT